MQTQSIPQNILEAAALVAEIIRRNRTNRLDKSKNLRLVPATQD